jgi:hypothetical protein
MVERGRRLAARFRPTLTPASITLSTLFHIHQTIRARLALASRASNSVDFVNGGASSRRARKMRVTNLRERRFNDAR